MDRAASISGLDPDLGQTGYARANPPESIRYAMAFHGRKKRRSQSGTGAPRCRPPKPRRPFEHRVEHRLKVAGLAVDDAQHLGGRGLPIQRLSRLADEPGVLHRDHGLRREILQQRDLLLGKRSHLLAIDIYRAEKCLVSFEAPTVTPDVDAAAVDQFLERRENCGMSLFFLSCIGDMDDLLATPNARSVGLPGVTG